MKVVRGSMAKKQSLHLWVITGTLLLVWLMLLFRMGEPFFGHHENPPVWMSSTVRNMNQFGAQAVDFLPLRNPGPTDVNDPDNWYYLNHPPTIVWLEAIATQLFGVNEGLPTPKESSIRMVGYIATMLTLPLFYVLIRRLTNRDIALVSFVLYAITPITLYFGRTPHYDIVLMPVVYLFMAVFINWMRVYTTKRTIMLTASAVFLMWIDWPGAFYLGACGLFALIFGNKQQRIGIISIGVITGLATAVIPLMYAILRPESINDLREVLELRTSTRATGIDSESFTLLEFLETYIEHMFTTTSVAVLLLGTLGIIRLFLQKKDRNTYFLLALIITPFVFMAIVPNAFNFHDWYKIHFLPGFSVAAGVLIIAGWHLPAEGIKKYAKPFIVAICVSSVGVTIFWMLNLHSTSTNNHFERNLAAELPLYTEEDDTIATNVNQGYIKVEYYAYRNIEWGVSVDYMQDWLPQQESVDLVYMLCLSSDTVDTYDGALSEYDYVVVADTCRLIRIDTNTDA